MNFYEGCTMNFAYASSFTPKVFPTLEAAPIIFVLDADLSVRKSLEALFRCEGWHAETFASAKDFLDTSRPRVPNCLVLDVSLPGLSGLDLQKQIANERPDMPIIFIASYSSVQMTVQAMKAGAADFLTKPFSDHVLVSAIRHALERSRAAQRLQNDSLELRDAYASLSPREREVMTLVVSGMLNKQVGAELGISEVTVKAHRGRVMQKMNAGSLADLVRIASRIESLTPAISFRLADPARTRSDVPSLVF
jgi:FixJ family two-component response regulator